jgi:AcrR family transcriptional regulator
MMLATVQRSHPGVEETRAKIVAAARELFERNGTRGTTTREVAELAGVNEATLFRHFGSKRALLDAMREACSNVAEFRSILASLPGTDFAADLRTIAYYTVEHMMGKRAMMCVSLFEDAAGTDDAPEWRGPSQILLDLAAYFTAQGQAGRALRADPVFVARYFMGILFSYVVGRKLWESTTIDRPTIDALVDVFLNGVCT